VARPVTCARRRSQPTRRGSSPAFAPPPTGLTLARRFPREISLEERERRNSPTGACAPALAPRAVWAGTMGSAEPRRARAVVPERGSRAVSRRAPAPRRRATASPAYTGLQEPRIRAPGVPCSGRSPGGVVEVGKIGASCPSPTKAVERVVHLAPAASRPAEEPAYHCPQRTELRALGDQASWAPEATSRCLRS
jgi:hypothetical protein